jgi:arsenate reductase (thioredoxin)
MKRKKVLFVCIHNSARSQMAEAFLTILGKDGFEAESAGLEPGQLNPLVVEAMKEIGIDIAKKKTQSTEDCLRRGTVYDYVITVCDETSSEACPYFPGGAKRLHWSFEDPSKFAGTHEERLEGARRIRDQIKDRINQWLIEERNHDR